MGKSSRQSVLPMLALLVLIANPLHGWWMSKENCRKVVSISCRVVSVAGGAALGSFGGPGGAAAGAAGGQLLSEVCEPVSKWICNKRSLSLVDPSMVEEFDRENHLYLFPQSFYDYTLEDGKITLDTFVDGVNAILPKHLKGLLDIAKEFMDADTNGDGALDEQEFLAGSWIATDGDLAELKRELIMHGMEF